MRYGIAFFSFLIVTFVAAPAMAEKVAPIQNINLRAGPGGHYPIIEELRRGEKLELLGCLEEMDWCEVKTRQEERGWVSTYYLETSGYNSRTLIESGRNGNIRIIIFKPRYYWDRYYKDKYFYKDRDYYLGKDKTRYPRRPREDNRPRPVPPVKQEQKPPKYQQQETGSRHKYNPLCRMGENDC